MRQLSTVAVLLLLAAPGGAISPKRPSDVAVLATSSASGPCGVTQYHVDRMHHPSDGPFSDFEVAEKRAFVVTSVGFRSSSGVSGRRYSFILQVDGIGAVAYADAGTADASGNLSGSVTLDGGVVVRRGTDLCTYFDHPAGDVPAFVRIHGFFTKDK